LGISIHLKGFHAAILDLDGNLVDDIVGKLPYEPSFFTQNCITILNDLIVSLKNKNIPIIGAVIAISGIINPKINIIDQSFVFKLKNYDFKKEISDKFPFPVLIENDANACAWGELFPQSPSMCTSFLYLLASTTNYNLADKLDNGMAIGIGVVAEGKMIYGAQNCAGELKSAFWEDTYSVENQVSIPFNRLVDIQNNESVFEEYINEIFISLGPVVSVLDPEAIIIGGDLKDKLSNIKKQLSSPNSKYYLGREQSRYKICSPSKGDNEISAGAACMFLIRLFKQDSNNAKGICSTRWKNIFAIKNHLS
jgi:predicted NBD/HSP70 family sugar kinase